jgi:hypothetical protein
MGAGKDDLARKPLTPGALGHGQIDPKECPPWNPAKNLHMLSGPHGGRKPVLGKAPALEECEAEYRGAASGRVTMELPNSLDELKRACAQTYKVNDVRVFKGGNKEIKCEADMKIVRVGDKLVVSDAQGQPIGIERRMAECERVEFTAISEAQAAYVPKMHGQQGVFFPGPYRQKEWRAEWLDQRAREAATKEPPRPTASKPEYPAIFGQPSTAMLDRHATDGPPVEWTKVGKSERVQSEMQEQFKSHGHAALAPKQDRKALTASDFSLFAHQPTGKLGAFHGRSETHAEFENPREKPNFEPPTRGVPDMPETEGHRRQLLRRQAMAKAQVDPKHAWWVKGKFQGTSEMASHFVDPTHRREGDCKPVRGVLSDWCKSDYFQRHDVVTVEPARRLKFKGQ